MGSTRGVLGATSDRRRTSSSYVSAGMALSCLMFVIAVVLMSGCAKQNPDPYGAKPPESAGMPESNGEPTDSANAPGDPDGGRPPAAKGSPIKIPYFQERGKEFDTDLKKDIESAFAQACKDAGNSPGCVTLSYVITSPDHGHCRFAGFDPDRPKESDVVTVDAGTAVVVKLSGSEPCPLSYTDNSTTSSTTTGNSTTGKTTTGSTTAGSTTAGSGTTGNGTTDNGTTGNGTTDNGTTGNEVGPTEPAAPSGG